MNCSEFRSSFVPQTEDGALLAHLRTCDPCLDVAAHADPDVIFRALGGAEITPPGGLDAFVDDVMHSVRIRSAESTLLPRRVLSWPRRSLAAAAVLTVVLTGVPFFKNAKAPDAARPMTARSARPVAAVAEKATKPVVETYSSAKATIVEVPMDSTNDVQVVMIFDDTLPADL
jgi:hypothetical protein